MKIKVLLALTAMSFLFCACPQVDPDSDSVDHDSKKVRSITWTGIYGDVSKVIKLEFKYDNQNRIQTVTEKIYYGGELEEDNNYSYAYSEQGLAITGSIKADRYGEIINFFRKYSYSFYDGLCTLYNYTQTWNETYKEEYSYSYDLLNQLSRIGKYKEYYGDGSLTESNYEWQGGNVKSIDEMSYEYYDIENKANIDLYTYLEAGNFAPTADRRVFKGFHSRNLVKTITYEGEQSWLAVYDIDNAGYVRKVDCNPISEGEWELDAIHMTIDYYDEMSVGNIGH